LIWDCSSGDRPKDYTSEKKDQKNIQMTPKTASGGTTYSAEQGLTGHVPSTCLFRWFMVFVFLSSPHYFTWCTVKTLDCEEHGF
jgi:hypothetical protein